jgi:uncharacterized protein
MRNNVRKFFTNFALISLIPVFAYMADCTSAAAAQQVATQQLPTEKLVIHTDRGQFPFTVEIADEPHEQSRGLMYRRDLAPDHGMLFDFAKQRVVTMWMKNTPLSLDMIFIRPDGRVERIAERTEPFSEDVISSGNPVAYVLEVNGGVARLIGLKAGDQIEYHAFSN